MGDVQKKKEALETEISDNENIKNNGIPKSTQFY